MEFFIIVIIILGIAGVIVGIFYAVAKKPISNQEKGQIGEERVNDVLRELDGILYANYCLVDHKGRSHQIDHIFICNRGVFVIETKNWNGKIYGNDNFKSWTVCYQNSHEKVQMLNPVKQNNGHVYQISKIIKNNVNIHNLVVIASDTYDLSHVESDHVIELCNLKKEILSYDIVFDTHHINSIVKELDSHRTSMTLEEHCKSIKEIKEDINNNICPLCQGKLVLRKKGNKEFYGCENYPKCKYTKNK